MKTKKPKSTPETITVFGKKVTTKTRSQWRVAGRFISYGPISNAYYVGSYARKSLRAAINDLERAILKDLAEAEKRVAELRKIVGKR